MTDRQLPELDYTGDPTHSLRLPELRVANSTLSRTLGRAIDCVTEISTDGEHKWDAMAHVAWVIAKRTAPETPLGVFTGATVIQLAHALEVRPAPDQPEPDPDAPTPSLEQLAEEAKEDPTGTPD